MAKIGHPCCNKTLVRSSRQQRKLLGLACCLLYNKPQSTTFNYVCLVMIIDEIHNAEYWKFHDTRQKERLSALTDRGWGSALRPPLSSCHCSTKRWNGGGLLLRVGCSQCAPSGGLLALCWLHQKCLRCYKFWGEEGCDMIAGGMTTKFLKAHTHFWRIVLTFFVSSWSFRFVFDTNLSKTMAILVGVCIV